jgi:8-oxo-dGTP diphosphatase
MREGDTTRLVSIAVLSGGRILLLRRAAMDSLPGYWETPGGGVEPGESFEAGAIRELAEETGLRVLTLREIRHRTGPAPRGFRRRFLELAAFALDLTELPEIRLDVREHSEFQWAHPADLGRLKMTELNRSVARLGLQCCDSRRST